MAINESAPKKHGHPPSSDGGGMMAKMVLKPNVRKCMT